MEGCGIARASFLCLKECEMIAERLTVVLATSGTSDQKEQICKKEYGEDGAQNDKKFNAAPRVSSKRG